MNIQCENGYMYCVFDALIIYLSCLMAGQECFHQFQTHLNSIQKIQIEMKIFRRNANKEKQMRTLNGVCINLVITSHNGSTDEALLTATTREKPSTALE